jgi:hypothetical protein
LSTTAALSFSLYLPKLHVMQTHGTCSYCRMGGNLNMLSESKKKKLLVVTAVSYWIVTILNVLELVIEGSSTINWVTTIVFFAGAVYFTSLVLKDQQKHARA